MRHSGADHNKTMVILGAAAPREEMPFLEVPPMRNVSPRIKAVVIKMGWPTVER